MTDAPTTEPPKQAEAPKAPEAAPPAADAPPAKREILDNLGVKFLLTIAAWLAPLPVTITLLKFWLTHFAPQAISAGDPFILLRHSLTNFSASTPDFMPLVGLVPSVVLLSILYRSLGRRIFVIIALMFIAVGELVTMMEIWGT